MLKYLFLFLSLGLQAQIVLDDFEGVDGMDTWFGDACELTLGVANPSKTDDNSSDLVLEYHDVGGQYANVRFDVVESFDLNAYPVFKLKVFVSSGSLTGNQPNQISLKLQNNALPEPWTTQTEVIKSVTLDQWQVVEFDFVNDPYLNINPGSLPPVQRTDLNRVVIQLNGENNSDQVQAFLDDISIEPEAENQDNPEPFNEVFDSLVWSDEFDGTGAVDETKWHHQTQFPNGFSWFNGEIQHYTDRVDNAYVSNGTLKMVAKKETFTDQGVTTSHTSARLNSKFAFTYGRVEIRAKLPDELGTWPALWTLGKNIDEDGGYWDLQGFGSTGWPNCGEIDIMEHWGDNQNFVQSATHTPSSFGGTINKGGQFVASVKNNFHVYSLDWYEDRLVFAVDGVEHYTYQPDIRDANTWPFLQEQYLLFNVAVLPSISESFSESAMEIDYVRVYQARKQQETSEEEQEEVVEEEPDPVLTGINDPQGISVFPNPASYSLSVGPLGTGQVRWGILNSRGVLLKSGLADGDQSWTVNGLNPLPQGTYYLKMHWQDQVIIRRFVIRR